MRIKNIITWMFVFITIFVFINTVNAELSNNDVLINDTFQSTRNNSLWAHTNNIDFGFTGYIGWPDNILKMSALANLSTLNTYSPSGIGDAYINLSYWWNIADYTLTVVAPGFSNQTLIFSEANPGIQYQLYANNSKFMLFGIENITELTSIDTSGNYPFYYISQLIYMNGSAQTFINGTLYDNRVNIAYPNTGFYITASADHRWFDSEAVDTIQYFDNLTLIKSFNESSNIYITFKDENNDSVINYDTITVDFISDSVNTNSTTSDGILNVNLTKNSYEIRYRTNQHTERSYYLTLNDSITLVNLTMYLLQNESGTFPLIVTIFDQNGRQVPNARLQALRYFPNSTTQYKLVLMKETNAIGEAPIDLELYGPYYKFQIIFGDKILFRDGPTQIYNTAWSYYINTENPLFNNFKKFGSIIYFHEYLNESNLTRLEWTDTESILYETCLFLYKTVNTEEQLVCMNCSYASTGILYCGIQDDNFTSYYSKARFKTNNPATYWDIFGIDFYDAYKQFGKEGLMYLGFFYITMIVIGLAAGPIAAAILGLFGVFIFNQTGIVGTGWEMLSYLFILVILTIVLIIKRRGIL